MAGLTAAIYARRANKTALVLENKAYGGQIINTVNIENWPGDYKVSGADLMKKVHTQAIDLGAKIEYEAAESITRSEEFWTKEDASEDTRHLWLVQTDESEYLAKSIIIATGTEPRKLSSKQARDAGSRPISYCATCDGALYKGKPVVVVGSGNTAKHETLYLKNIASKVYHIHHDDPIPEDATAVFVAIGRVPNTDIFEDVVDLDESGYIVAGENCITSTDGIFAAGDCRTKDVRQLVTAAADGAVAATTVVDYLNQVVGHHLFNKRVLFSCAAHPFIK